MVGRCRRHVGAHHRPSGIQALEPAPVVQESGPETGQPCRQRRPIAQHRQDPQVFRLGPDAPRIVDDRAGLIQRRQHASPPDIHAMPTGPLHCAR
ncbi:hypothetical protein G6F57_022345 [Rhizopus arrhizus]|nr:hypothetical protein G6F57_022345 [Rhizopus arrhizus]